MKIDALVLNPHQARKREPTPYENQLADAIEHAFAQGDWELEQLVSSLNAQGVPDPEGQPWTSASFEHHIHQLAQG